MFKNVLKLLISIGVLAVLFSKVDLLQFSTIMRSLDPICILSAVAIQFVLSVIQTERWRIILSAGKIRIRLVGAWLNVMIGLCFNQVLPSSVGGDAIRVYNARSLGLGLALRSILIDRLIALFTLSILSFFYMLHILLQRCQSAPPKINVGFGAVINHWLRANGLRNSDHKKNIRFNSS